MSELESTLANHPRLLGALFTMTLLTAQAGSAMAKHCTAYHGP